MSTSATESPSSSVNSVTSVSSLLRVEKGDADAEELAAITAVLLARASAQPDAAPTGRGRTTAGWRRLERQSGFRTAHSWQG